MTKEERLQGLAIAKSLFSYLGNKDEVKKIDEAIDKKDKELFNEKYYDEQIKDAISFINQKK